MYEVTTKEYAGLLRKCEKVKQPLFVQGSFGIGKSAIPRQVFKEIAAERKLKFIEWSDLSLEEKEHAINNPGQYYAFMDARTSQMDTTSLQGIPNMSRTDRLENIPYSWVVFFTQPKAHGALFFDEINLAAPIVQSITYSAIHDRVVSDRRLSDDIFVFAAGNRQKDRAHTFDMPMPLRDRFAECEVRIDGDAWMDWARSVGVNPHLISFIAWKPSYLDKTGSSNADKPSTPRGVHRASNLIKGHDLNSESDTVHQLVSISCGQAFATEFEAYVKCFRQLNWNKIFKTPSSVGEFKMDMQYAVAGGLADIYQQSPDDEKKLGSIIDVVVELKPEMAVHTLRMMRDINSDRFGKSLRNIKRGADIANRYAKFIIDGAS